MFPPGSNPTTVENWIEGVWQVADSIQVDCNYGDFVHFWDNRHLENVLLHTPDNLINKIGRIQGRFPDGSYMILLIGQADIATNNYRLSLRGDQTRCFAESFKRIYPGLMKEQDITGTTHAFGAFMQCVESLNE
jgi:hypothetical protein